MEINNNRIILDKLACSIEDLAQFGPLKPEELRGLSGKELIEATIETMPKNLQHWGNLVAGPNQRQVEDKTNYRTGIIQEESICQMMIQESQKIKQLISKNKVELKQQLFVKDLREAF